MAVTVDDEDAVGGAARGKGDDLRAVLRLITDAFGLGPKAWAVKAGLAPSTVSNFINKPTKKGMNQRTLDALARAVPIDPSVFFLPPGEARQAIALVTSGASSDLGAGRHLLTVKIIPVPLLTRETISTVAAASIGALKAGWAGDVVPGMDLGRGIFAYRVDCGCVARRVPKGSTIFVDALDVALVDGGLYVLEHRGAVCLREYRTDAVVRFSPNTVEEGHAEIFPAVDRDVRVVGRVRSVMQFV